MAHPQNSPRGLFSKQGFHLVGTNGLYFDTLSASSAALNANSTGLIFAARAAKPTTRSSAKVTFITNTTGVNGIAINTTGTTWKYINVTTVLPT